MPLHRQSTSPAAHEATVPISPQFVVGGEPPEIPRHRLPDAELDPRTAYQTVHDELLLDGNARLNLATFVTTWMEPEAEKLIAECLDKNMIDKDEYPITAELESRCVSILADLWNAPGSDEATGCSTTGSSEACMLAGMALLRRWRAAGGTGTPNLVMGANVQVCWEKFCRYWDVEPRLQKVSAEHTGLSAQTAVAACDEQTIGVVAILGSTFDGIYEPVTEIAAALDDLAARGGADVPMHVDGASGGFIAPFLDPHLRWDFRLKRVQSINASGHKYGLVYPGVGWIVWRDQAALPDDLVFKVDYLGGDMPTFALNFSRPGAQVVAQYYTLLRLGREGYRRVQQHSRDVCMWLAGEIDDKEEFTAISDGSGIPAFAFRMADGFGAFNVYDVSAALRVFGWIVPAYPMPEGLEDMGVLRIVVRNGFSRDLGGLLLADLDRALQHLHQVGGAPPEKARASFHH
ncbi:MAG TPA: glutamate decarboxylase [Solirubrobacteraceae bacterium]|jgi:glutamate decarboxylase